jgi:hypothetical protein
VGDVEPASPEPGEAGQAEEHPRQQDGNDRRDQEILQVGAPVDVARGGLGKETPEPPGFLAVCSRRRRVARPRKRRRMGNRPWWVAVGV